MHLLKLTLLQLVVEHLLNGFSTFLINANTSLLFPFFSLLILWIPSRFLWILFSDDHTHMEQNRLVAPITALIFISFSTGYLA